MATSSTTFPGVPGSAGDARRWTAGILAAAGYGDVDTAVLLVSELVTNSVQHSRSGRDGGEVRVSVTVIAGAYVELGVRDDGPAGDIVPVVPGARQPADAESGRGLWLAGQLAGSPVHSDGRGTARVRMPWNSAAAPALAAAGAGGAA